MHCSPEAKDGMEDGDAMTTLFDSFGPALRPVVQLAAGYGAAAALTAAATLFRVPPDHARWLFTGAAAPAIALALGAKARTADRMTLAATSTLIFLTGTTVVAVPTIQAQLVQAAPGERLRAIVGLDPVFLVAFAAGAACLGLLVRLTLEGDEGFTRPRASVLGDARWMSMREAKSLFPPTGKVVVGEAYGPWKERYGSTDMVPSNPRTWSSGGKHQVLFYDFTWGSTHMLVFAGSGGFKTTSTVIPTARYYPGSMVILDPALEIGQQVAPLRKRLKGPSGQPRKVVTIDPLASTVQGCDVLELLRKYFGIADADDGATRREKVSGSGKPPSAVRAYSATLIGSRSSRQVGRRSSACQEQLVARSDHDRSVRHGWLIRRRREEAASARGPVPRGHGTLPEIAGRPARPAKRAGDRFNPVVARGPSGGRQ